MARAAIDTPGQFLSVMLYNDQANDLWGQILLNGQPRALFTAKLVGLGGLQETVMSDVLDAAVIGDMVLAAILADDAYIFSHPGLKPVVDARSAAIDESFARWSLYRKDRGI